MKKKIMLLILTAVQYQCTQIGLGTEKESVFSDLGLLAVRSSRQTISGTAVKGLIRNGKVTVSSVQSDGTCSSSLLQSDSTNSDGDYTLTFGKKGGAYCLTVGPNAQGTTKMYDEKTGTEVSIPADSKFQITTIYPESKITGNKKSNFLLSPFSRMLTKRIQYLMKSGAGTDVSQLHTRASRELVIRFGLNKGLSKGLSTNDASVSDLEDILIDLQNPSSSLSAKFVSILMGFSYLANKYKSGSALDSLDAIMDALASDFADGVFDGKDANGQSITVGSGASQLTLSSTPLTTVLIPSIQSYFQEGGKLNIGSGAVTASFDTTQISSLMSFVDNTPISYGTASLTVAGTVTGLSGSGLVLLNNGGDPTTVSSGATSFTMNTKVESGSTYNITIQTQPSGLLCSVANGTGTASANVTNVKIGCSSTASLILHWAFENSLSPGVGTASLTLAGGTTAYSTGYNGIGSSLIFNGTTYYNLSGSTVTAKQDQVPPWTVAVWVYPISGGDPSQAIIAGSSAWWSIKAKQSTGYIGITKAADDSFGTTALALNTWTHITVTSDGSIVKLYINGVFNSSLNTASAIGLGYPLHRIGAIFSSVADRYSGQMDELRVYSASLSAAEVSTLYSSY